MKTKITTLLVLVFVSFVLAGCCTAHSKAKQWEYAENDFSTSDISTAVTALNNSALEGWILVSAVPIKSSNGEDEIRYIFKRPKH
jgi:hypothetical protein